MAMKILILIFVNVLTFTQAARILGVFPFPSISHQVVFRKLTQELAQRGHEIIVITPDPAFGEGAAPANFKEIDIHNISYKIWEKSFQKNYKVNKKYISFSQIRRSPVTMGNIFEKQLQSLEVKKLLSDVNQKFDLIIVEALILPALAFTHVFKAPTILVSSLGSLFKNHEIMGSLIHPLLFPPPFHKRVYNLTLYEKIEELYNHFSIEYALYLNENDENALLRKNFGTDIPPLNELYNNVDMLFINIHSIWADNQPVPPNVVYMGGIHQSPAKELPKDLKTYLDSSRHGVIYLSFGTNVLSGMMPTDKIRTIINVLSDLPYDVLWKWDKDVLPGKSDNIRISKWFPQSDLLKHPKVKLFITQAGLQSTDEAITAGVPLVAIPMFFDQWYNAEKYVKHGIGMQLNIENLTKEKFKYAVETVIKDHSYRKNIVKLRHLMRDQPETPLQRAIWWCEYVIRHGGAKHLRAASANKSYVQYYEIEVILLIILIALILLIAIVTVIILGISFFNKLKLSSEKMKND